MKTSKTLLAILVEYLPKNGGWPDATTSIGQDWDRELMFYGRGCVRTGIILDDLAIDHRKRFENGVKITREQYESALNAHAEEKPEGKTLLQILTEELPKRGGWPKFERKLQAVQDADGEIKFHIIGRELNFERNKTGNWGSDHESAWLLWQVRETGEFVSNPNINCVTLASDYTTAIITREQYEAALAEKEHPLPWDEKKGDEADLNDCIGQAPAPVYSGYGVPPVGAAIEWREGRRWYPGTVSAIGEQLIIIKDQHGEEGSYSLEHTDFRRANFEVDELAAVIDASDEGGELIPSHQKAIAKHLIDAGYRKQ